MNILHMLKHDFLIIGFAGPLRSGCTTSAEFFTDGLQKEIQKQTENYSLVQKEIEVLYRKTRKHKELDGSRQAEQLKNDLRQLLKKREALKVLSDYLNNNFVYISMTDILIKSSIENMGEEIKLAYNYQKSKAKFEILKGLMRKITSDYPDIKELKRLSSYTKERDFNKFKKEDFLKFEQYLQRVRETRRKLPKWLSYDDDMIGELLQDFGDNLRRCGNPWDYKTPYSISNPSTVFTLAEEANNIIKVFRSRERQKEAKKPRVKQFVVEAFRNPYEVEFFRNRYHEFYLISLFADYEIRSKRGAFSLKRDERDRGEDLTTEEFYKQNVSECVRLSDIAINNERRKPELPSVSI